mmetsp:Transcript_34776/g.68652  ORF Transcript_34776/g.68652 Transcript_34776/m.68652 type:complete len:204 (-) Transcript_34776:192-803(-)
MAATGVVLVSTMQVGVRRRDALRQWRFHHRSQLALEFADLFCPRQCRSPPFGQWRLRGRCRHVCLPCYATLLVYTSVEVKLVSHHRPKMFFNFKEPGLFHSKETRLQILEPALPVIMFQTITHATNQLLFCLKLCAQVSVALLLRFNPFAEISTLLPQTFCQLQDICPVFSQVCGKCLVASSGCCCHRGWLTRNLFSASAANH